VFNKKFPENNDLNQNEKQSFEEIERGLNSVKKDLERNKILDAQKKLQEISKRLQDLPDHFIQSRESLKNKYNETIEELNNSIYNLANLSHSIQHKQTNKQSNSLEQSQEGRQMASSNFNRTVDIASNDKNVLANLAGKAIKRLNS
jgi:hypothetical protein